jgi:pyruvate dehydrogenase E2 component (dihydrolipoamide acetyltransferase)
LTTIATLESDKATMDVPSTAAGVVKECSSSSAPRRRRQRADQARSRRRSRCGGPGSGGRSGTGCGRAPWLPRRRQRGAIVEVKVPDIGDFSDVPVIELFVKVGDSIKAEDAIATLESDKATMDVPSSATGVVKEVLVQLGSKVSEGAVLIKVETGAGAAAPAAAKAKRRRRPHRVAGRRRPAPTPPVGGAHPRRPPPSPRPSSSAAWCTPALGACLRPRTRRRPRPGQGQRPQEPHHQGRRHRLHQGRHEHRRRAGQGGGRGPVGSLGGGLDLLPWPKVDFAKFGEIEVKPLSRIKKISGQNLARNWAMIPAVTYHEDADITDLEAFRVQMNKDEKSGKKLTMLAFIIKASVRALQEFPEFNTSLDGDNLV